MEPEFNSHAGYIACVLLLVTLAKSSIGGCALFCTMMIDSFLFCIDGWCLETAAPYIDSSGMHYDGLGL